MFEGQLDKSPRKCESKFSSYFMSVTIDKHLRYDLMAQSWKKDL